MWLDHKKRYWKNKNVRLGGVKASEAYEGKSRFKSYLLFAMHISCSIRHSYCVSSLFCHYLK